MALTASEFADLRQLISRKTAAALRPIDFTKAQINAAIQACVDRLDNVTTRTTISNDIEAAAPTKFDAADKTLIFATAVMYVARREGVL